MYNGHAFAKGEKYTAKTPSPETSITSEDNIIGRSENEIPSAFSELMITRKQGGQE